MKMETNPQTSETDQEQRVSTSEEQDPRHARFYECTFCKRGFSNAQALGGHMNIHRKDRAKLKQHSSESQLSLDITKKNPSDPPVSSDHHQLDLESTDEISCTLKTPSIRSREADAIVRDQTHLEELQNQTLFFGTLPMSKDLQSSSCTVDHKETKISSSHDSSQEELDLELRLGPEPHDTSAKGTKKLS